MSRGGPKALKDGAVCVIGDGEVVFATAEERVSRVKHDGGYAASLDAALSWLELDLSSFDLLVSSSCCETTASPYSLYIIVGEHICIDGVSRRQWHTVRRGPDCGPTGQVCFSLPDLH
jgi:predicted NodU family carbamoyl transferase